MINVLMCAHQSGDVIGLALRQLIDAPCVTKILIADGPHIGHAPGTTEPDAPSVRSVVDGLASAKVLYQYTDNCHGMAEKGNRALEHVSPDCQWMLYVESDEVYHEDGLARLAEFLTSAPYGRYWIKTADLYPDFDHCIMIDDWKPRIYRWYPGARCQSGGHHYQFILHASQKLKPNARTRGMDELPCSVCQMFHLNGLRKRSRRVCPQPDGTVIWLGGGQKRPSRIHNVARAALPRSLRDSKKRNL